MIRKLQQIGNVIHYQAMNQTIKIKYSRRKKRIMEIAATLQQKYTLTNSVILTILLTKYGGRCVLEQNLNNAVNSKLSQ